MDLMLVEKSLFSFNSLPLSHTHTYTHIHSSCWADDMDAGPPSTLSLSRTTHSSCLRSPSPLSLSLTPHTGHRSDPLLHSLSLSLSLSHTTHTGRRAHGVHGFISRAPLFYISI